MQLHGDRVCCPANWDDVAAVVGIASPEPRPLQNMNADAVQEMLELSSRISMVQSRMQCNHTRRPTASDSTLTRISASILGAKNRS
jgi:hypothetical protein